MSRHLFGLWGIELDENEFAEALAGAALVEVREDVAVAVLAFTQIPPTISTDDARATWQKAGRKRIEVQRAGQLDLLWLNAMLARVAAVYFRSDEPDVAVAWEWPLRIGLLEDDRGSELQQSLSGSSLQQIVRFVTLTETVTECELLLIPYNLRTSVARVLTAPARITADCVIVMGGAKADSDRVAALLRTLRTEVRTAGVAVASVPKEKRRDWMHALVAELAHNKTIDDALQLAAARDNAAPPLLVCSRKLAELARVARYVERVGTALRRMAPDIKTIELEPETTWRFGESLTGIGERLEREADTFPYEFERDETKAVVLLRRSIERGMNERLVVPRMTAAAKPPRAEEESFDLAVPLPAAPPADRFVRADFHEDRDPARYAERVEPRHPYFVRIRIAPEGGRGAKADTAFDESKLPPSPTGHELTIALFELRDGGHEPASPPSKMTVHLPPDRAVSSTDAWFPVLTPPGGAFVARVVVLHETRVLQTLILRAPTSASQNDLTLKQENVVRKSFEGLGARRTFDAALILNDAGGVPAVMAVTGKSVAYKEPVDLRTAIESITKTVNGLTKLADANDITIDDDDVVSVLIRLANDGHILSKWIARNLPPEIAGAERIQILEAREGAFLPLEFVYPSYAPEDTATICPHGKEELAHPKKTKCPNERDRNFVCPAVFWGFSRVLERFPHPPADRELFDYRLSTPQPERTTIHPFESALIGASAKVRTDDVTGADGVVPAMRALVKDVFVAQTWDDWSTEIQLHSPSLLLLFPHSDEVDGNQALEIGSKFLKISFLEEEYVRRTGEDPGPLVLLLGCSTTLTRVRFHSFVAEFRALGASIVVGTLSLIRGRHATRFVKEFVGALSKRVGTPDAVFGDVLLDVKRSMLAAGDPFALTLMAYGDADWRL